MKRRRFLAVGLAGVVAGCSTRIRPNGSGSAASTTTTAETRTTTASNQTTDLVRHHLEEADRLLTRAENRYVSWGGVHNGSVLGVTAASGITDDPEYILDLIAKAKTHARKAQEHGDGSPPPQINWARTLADWVRVQRHLIAAYRRLGYSAFNAVVEHRFDEARSHLEEFRASYRKARSALEAHRDWQESNGPGTGPLPVDRAVYRAKMLQFRTELHAIAFVAPKLETLVPALETFGAGVEAYLAGDYASAASAFADAEGTFETVVSRVREFCCAPSSVAPTVENLECVASALAPGTAALERAANAGKDGDTGRRTRLADEAETEFGSCQDLAQNNPAVGRFLDR
jgi:hypothetical protein